MYARTENTWTQQAKLLASDGVYGDGFGYSGALAGETALVGAHWYDDNGEADDAAYIFTRTGNSWTQQAKLQAARASCRDSF